MHNLFLSNTISFFLLTYLGNSLLEIKKMNKRTHILIYFLCVIFLTFLNGRNVNLYNTLNLTFGYIIYLLCVYNSSIIKKVLVLLSFILFNAIGEILAASILNVFLGLNATSNISSFQYTVAILLSTIIICLFLTLFIKIIKFSYWGDLPKYTYLITILPITTFFLLINIQDYFYLLRKHEMLVFTMIGLLISNFVIVFIFLKTTSSLKLKNELEMTKIEKKSIDFKYELLNSQYKANYSFMHDTIRAIMKMESLLANERYAEFKSELQSLNNRMLRGLNIVNSNSSIISPIINFRLEEMLNNDIDFKSVIEYTDFTFLDIYEQRYIFDTLLEIGMLQCNNSNTKLIILKTKKLYQQIIIQLITARTNAIDSENYVLLYNKLSEIVYKNNGKMSHEDIDNNSSSFVIIFDINNKFK